MKKLIALLAVCGVIQATAQNKRIGDYIESMSYNDGKAGSARTLQYRPEGRAFVSENGSNRFTRALYGSHTDWRLETSDRPVFAVAKKNHHRNIRLVVNGVPLDATDFCRAAYEDGMRSYVLRDQRWGSGTLCVKVVSLYDEEGAVWQLATTGVFPALDVQVKVCQIAQPKLQRNGDIGADRPGVFEHDPQEKGLQVSTAAYADERRKAATVVVRLDSIAHVPYAEAVRMYDKAFSHWHTMAQRIQFDTPDPYINTLGSALVMAADGDWDGETWLHGCVGWRMPLAGWRAGYLGDVLGWNERAVKHFNAYANSQVRDVAPVFPHPTQDPQQQLARAEKKWGTQMYSNGYICRNPNRNNQMHHYDMNLNYVDELLWHFQYDADTTYMRQMWPVLTSHLAWEKRNYDPDGDHLYDAYCCIWASDALYYSGGAVTHSSAYNYRGHLLAARIAELLGEDATPYRKEADAILQAMNSRLWLADKGHWAEYQDLMGLQRVHEHAAVWSIYTPIDCGACTTEQAFQATRYVDRKIPHIKLNIKDETLNSLSLRNKDQETLNSLSLISTSSWMPYSWSINNVAAAEEMHTALAFFEAGRSEAGFQLMKANVLDQMYYGQSPANFGQISHYDAARGECYRDFGDCIGISSRTLLQGLFGIVPQALYGQCLLRPGFPKEWDSVHVKTPYIEYRFVRKGNKERYEITQHFRQPLCIVLRQNLGQGRYRDVTGTTATYQVIEVERADYLEDAVSPAYIPETKNTDTAEPVAGMKYRPQRIERYFNASVKDIFQQEYRSPRPPYTTLQIPLQGIGEWCHPHYRPDINDSVFRSMIHHGQFVVAGVPFRTPVTGRNIIYTSLWDNYPDSVTIPLQGRGESLWLLMAGSTNHMQYGIDNALVTVSYADGTADTLYLRPPYNWCPIEQDYYVDGQAFRTAEPRPYRVAFGTGTVSRQLGEELAIKGVYGREIPGGAAQMLCMPLQRNKKVRSLTLRTLSNDVVIGLMGVTLAR